MSFIVTVEWLENRLEKNPDNTVIVDARSDLGDPNLGKEAYAQGHIPSAVYLDLKEDLSGEPEKHGGRHPLPIIDTIAKKLGTLGIDMDTIVIVYGQTNDMFAARAWWQLHYMGHENVYLLEGGLDEWINAGNSTSDKAPKVKSKHFHPKVRPNEVATMNEVIKGLNNSSALLIDSRAKDRYLGNTEKMYAKAGHIPGAKSFFWKGVLNDDGSWKNKEQLQSHFSSLDKDDEIIVSCGSGISACPNVVALKMAGYSNVKLYTGGYSDWISYEDNKVETKDE